MLSAIVSGAAAIALVLTTQNVRQGLPADQTRHDIHQAAQGSSVVLTQEMGKRHAASYAPAGWGSAHFLGLRRGDCATYWDRDQWRLVSKRVKPLTFADFRAGHRWALVTVLRGHQTTVAVVCVHMITRWVHRRAVEAAGIARLRTLLATLRSHWPHVLVGGDWNRPWPVRAHLPRFHSVRPGRATGPKGGGVDYFQWHGARYRGSRVIGHTFSDHNGFRVRLGL